MTEERRRYDRHPVTWAVDCVTEETFLYAAITNISEMGIFVRTTDPLGVGTSLTLRFTPTPDEAPFVLRGVVQWVNPVRENHDNPNRGRGVSFVDLPPPKREVV